MELKRNVINGAICLFDASFLMPTTNNSTARCDGPLIPVSWQYHINAIYSPCPQVKVGIGTSLPKRNLHLRKVTCSDYPFDPFPKNPATNVGNPSDPVEVELPRFTTNFRLEDERQDKNGTFLSNSTWDAGVSAQFDRFFINRVGKSASGFFSVNATGLLYFAHLLQ